MASVGRVQENVIVEVVVSTLSKSTGGGLGGRTEEGGDGVHMDINTTIQPLLNSPSLIGFTVTVVLGRYSEVAVMDMI